MTEIGSRGKTGVGHSRLGSRSGCVISETDITHINQKADLALSESRRGIANTNKGKPCRRIAFKEIGNGVPAMLDGQGSQVPDL